MSIAALSKIITSDDWLVSRWIQAPDEAQGWSLVFQSRPLCRLSFKFCSRPQFRNRILFSVCIYTLFWQRSGGSERAPYCRVAHQLLQETQDSPVQSSPGLRIETLHTVSVNLSYALIVCVLYVLALVVLSIMLRLILAIFVVYGEWVNLATASPWHVLLLISLL